ncbi:MAG: LicD family protein [Eubacterium sp.]|nr:LicD family protein [Eubacterium sp.]
MKKELTSKELQKVCTELLKKFDEICKENSLKYSAAGGTMLGAVRHGGFIPWDDDVDVNMPREDYEKLLKLQYEDEQYKILNYRYIDNYYHSFTKMIDKTTEIDEPLRGEKNMGVYIDIFPVDYVGDYETEAPKVVKKAWKNSNFWQHLGSDVKYHRAFTPKYLAKLIFRGVIYPFRKKLLYHFDTMFTNIPKSEYCANLQLGTYGMGECFKSELWEDMIYLPFEDIEICAFRDYDSYLSSLFGDYMTPPPEDKRESTHTFTAYKK